MTRPGERLAGPLAAGLLVAAYVAALRRYGIFDFADEGLLLVQAWRTARGQVPYVDFQTGYGPLYFHLQGLLVAAGGMAAVRWALVAVHGASAALSYALARRLAGPALGAVAVALEVAFFLPVASHLGAPFNVPYPAWYAGLGGVALAVLLGAERPRGGRVVLAGALAGAVFAMKPNSGLLLAGGAAGAVVLRDGAGGWTGRLVLVLLALGAVMLVAPTGASVAGLVLVPPVVALAVLGWPRGAGTSAVARPLLALAAGFAAVAAACFAPSLEALGPARFAREVLLLDGSVARIYALPFPWPGLVGAAGGALVFLGRRAGNRGLVAVGAGTLALALLGGTPSGGGSVLRRGAEGVMFALVPFVLWGALASRAEAALVAPTAVGTLAALQLYPRPDLLHLMPLGPLLLPLAVGLWRALLDALPAWRGAAVAVPLAAAAGRLAPAAVLLARLATGRVDEVEIGAARLVIEPAGAERLRALAAAAETVRTASAPGAATIAFPACGLVPFFAQRTPAGPHDYFFPGRPDRAEVEALTAHLAAAPPPVAVTCDATGTELEGAWDRYPELVAFVDTRYRVVLARPPFVVRALRD